MRCSTLIRMRTPSASAMLPASVIICAASSRVAGVRQIPASVAPVSALIGLKARLPQALTHRCERISVSTLDLNPAEVRASPSALARSDLVPSSSPTGKRSPSTWVITPGAVFSAAG